jgi:TonB family protein
MGSTTSRWLRLCLAGFAAAVALVRPSSVAAQTPDEVVAPRAITTPSAPYPDTAHGDASVLLELTVAEDGSVADVRVRNGAPPFDDAAVLAARQWRFEPASRGGIPVRARILARIDFHAPPPVPPSRPTATPAREVSQTPAPSPAPQPVEITVAGEEREELGSTHVPRNDTRNVPGAFADPFRVVEILPSVAPILSGLPYFYVRGAPPGDTGYFIDSIRVPILFHVGAGPSVIAPALVDRTDLYPSAYPARYGRFAGGIMTGETTEPRNRPRGEAQARVFDAGALVEQPFESGNTSVLLGGRYSYTGALLAAVAPDYVLDYHDYQARISRRMSARDRLTLFAFGGFDQLRNGDVDRTLFDVRFDRVDLRYDRDTGDGHVRLATTLSHDHALNADEEPGDPTSIIESNGVRVRLEFDQRLGPGARVRGGIDGAADRVSAEHEQRFHTVVIIPPRMDLSSGTSLDAVLRPGRGVELVPGVRVDAGSARRDDYVFVEPRFASRLRVAQGVAWIGALGLTHQLPSSTVHVPGYRPTSLELARQRAWQASESLEVSLPLSMLGKATVFYSMIDSRDTPVRGRIYGLELFARRDFVERLGGFLSYTLSRSERIAANERFAAPFDRPHVVSAALGYAFGRGYRAGIRTYAESGRPYLVECPTPDCGPGDPTAPRPFERRGRLPGYARVDVRFEKRWTFSSGNWIAATFEWFNASLTSETSNMDWSPTRGLTPFTRSPLTLPSVGVEAGY